MYLPVYIDCIKNKRLRLRSAVEVGLDDSDEIEEGSVEVGHPTSVGFEGPCLADRAVGEEEVFWEEGGAVEENLIGSAKGAGIGDYHYIPLFLVWVNWGMSISRRERSHLDTIFFTYGLPSTYALFIQHLAFCTKTSFINH